MPSSENASLQLRQRQEQRISPKQLQAITVLQMPVTDLADYIQQAILENPLLEYEPAENRHLDGFAQDRSFYAANTSVSPSELAGRIDPAINGLPLFLSEQLARKKLPTPLLRCCIYLITLLDDRGYLQTEDVNDAAELFDRKTLTAAITELQSLDPAGIAAKDLSECLCLQLKRHYPHELLAMDIAAHHLSQLGQRRYREIAHALQATERMVIHAAQLIATLEPNPCADFTSEMDTPYIQPDVVILESDGKLTAVLADWLLPRLSICSNYRSLLQQADSPEVVAYLRQREQQAKWLLDNIQRRGKTLQRCADMILQKHLAFFGGQARELQPLTAARLADELGVHPSTVSRALQGKHLQCRFGVFPLQYFCTGSVADNALSRQAIESRIALFIQNEDPNHPRSDADIQKELAQAGVVISRRAITKYRNHLHIPSASLRRRRG